MNVLVIADDDKVLESLPDVHVDLMISCGDLTDDLILAAAEKCSCPRIFAVKGNHDSSSPFRPPIHDLHLQTAQFRGKTFGGFCGSWKYKPRGNYLFEQSEVAAALKDFPKVDVFVAHNSPRSVHDREDEVHTGFVGFATYINDHKPHLFLHGHQHVQIETMVGLTKVVGTYGHRFLTITE